MINKIIITNNHTAQDTIEGHIQLFAMPLWTEVHISTSDEEIIQYLQGNETHLKIDEFPNMSGQYQIKQFSIHDNRAHVQFIRFNVPKEHVPQELLEEPLPTEE